MAKPTQKEYEVLSQNKALYRILFLNELDDKYIRQYRYKYKKNLLSNNEINKILLRAGYKLTKEAEWQKQ